MKMFVVCHQWLKPVQHGIQGAHAVVEMMCEHGDTDNFFNTYFDWVNEHKTLVFLDGGGSGHLIELSERISKLTDDGIMMYPTLFQEDEYSLEFATTALSFLGDEKFCEMYDNIKLVAPDNRLFILTNEYEMSTDSANTILEIMSMKIVK